MQIVSQLGCVVLCALLTACGGRVGTNDGSPDGAGDGFAGDRLNITDVTDATRPDVAGDSTLPVDAVDANDDPAVNDDVNDATVSDDANDATVSDDANDAAMSDDADGGGSDASATDAGDVVSTDTGGCVSLGPETCNGLDDDCNGLVDDAIAPRSCYSGPAGTDGVAACHGGTQTCAGGTFGACTGEVTPATETCDGADNDCNGTADDGVAPQACYPGPVGTRGVGPCIAGTQACAGGVFGACVGAVIPATETCDGVDNDCNGTADDGIVPVSCYSGPAGTTGVGACRAGTRTCSGGTLGACIGEVVPTAEVCDGIDNECNGAVDNGIAPVSCYSGPAGTSGVGACHGGTRSCTGGALGACVGEVVPVTEACDGVDNNCNGSIDDGIAPVSCYPGPAGTLGVGLCRAGTQTCSGGAFGACTGAVIPTAEVCDARDNDCNGPVDDGIGPTSCYTGPPGTLGVGLCAAGSQACVGGVPGPCVGQVVPTAEICNGRDDNCDGRVDEGNPGGGVACGPALGGCVAITACIAGTVTCRGTFVAPAPIGATTNDGTQATPLSSITAAIANAVAIGGGADVCVCDPPTAGASTFTENVSMVEGTSVLGGYNCSAWSTRTIATYVTRIQDTDASGVDFNAGITSATALDGMSVAGMSSAASPMTAAITVTDSSPTLVDDTVAGGLVPTSIGLLVQRTASGTASPTVTRGSYTATATNGGTQIAIELNRTTATLTTVSASGAASAGGSLPATSVGLRCIDCGATTISAGNYSGGTASDLADGLWASGNVTGLTDNGGTFVGGNTTNGTSTGRAVYLDTCTGMPRFTAANMIGGFGNVGTRIGMDVTGASCNPTVTAGTITGCEVGPTCIAFQSTGAPATVTGATITGVAGTASVANYGVRCLSGGCTTFSGNTISAGTYAGVNAGSGIGVELDTSSPLFDSNNIRGPACRAPPPGRYYGALLHGSRSVFVNNVVRDNACPQTEDVVRFEKVSLGPALVNPIVVNNTIEYTACTGCGERHGLAIRGVPGSLGGPAGVFNNNIIRNTAAGGITYPVYEYDFDGDVISFLNNDLYDPTATALFWYHGTTPYTLVQVNALPGAGANIIGNPLLDATWHIPTTSPCHDRGTPTSAPNHDFDGQARPDPLGAFDIGADEFY